MANTDRCTRGEAVQIIRVYLEGAQDNLVEGAEDLERRYKPLKSMNRAQLVERLKTMSDETLVSLTTDQGASTFVIVESNRRFLDALQKEAKRTTRLTWGVFFLTAVLVIRELLHLSGH